MATINGTSNDDTLKGGAGNDIITGGLGNDLAWMGGGNDVFIWNAPHGNDTIEGQAGFDTLRFFGDSKDETIEISADGTRTKVHWSVLDHTLDLNDVERIDIRAREGFDWVRVHDLSGTDVKQVAVDLSGAVLGIGDGVIDTVEGHGTNGNDAIAATFAGGKVTVAGLSAQMTISNVEAADRLALSGAEGNDIINASQLAFMTFIADGGEGNDRITGSKGSDGLYGQTGDDIIVGGAGNDEAYLGWGDDVFAWYVGDGEDKVNGDVGTDTVRLTGSNANEHFSISTETGYMWASLGGPSTVQADNVERVQIRALGGGDTVSLYDLTDSEVRYVAVDLAAKAGGTLADASVDTVQVMGTLNDDVVDISWSGSSVRVAGLAARIDVAHAGATDILAVYGRDGNDTIIAGSLPGGKMRLQLDGGSGDDLIVGSGGNDTVTGGTGNDLAFLAAGNDRFVWAVGAGSDKVEGQTGIDTLEFRGTSGVDTFTVEGYSSGQVVFRSGAETVAAIDVERLQLSTAGGSDWFAIDQGTLAYTDVTQVAIDLGQGDGQSDVVHVSGTAGNEQVTIAMSGSLVSVSGYQAQMTIAHAEAQDKLSINVGTGDDVITATSMPAGTMLLSLDGSYGNDTVTGSAGDDDLIGWDGNDVLRGGAGADYLSGGKDNDDLAGGAGIDSLDGGDGNDKLSGGAGVDTLNGGAGDDVILGGLGNDEIWGGTGNDTFRYTSTLDGHDLIQDFDGDAAGGQDTLNLDALFDALGVANGARAGRVNITDNGGTVDIFVNADGNSGNGFELHVATLNTVDQITIGQDVILS